MKQAQTEQRPNGPIARIIKKIQDSTGGFSWGEKVNITDTHHQRYGEELFIVSIVGNDSSGYCYGLSHTQGFDALTNALSWQIAKIK